MSSVVNNPSSGSYPGSGTGVDESADSGKGVIYDGAGRVPGMGFYGTTSAVSPKSVTVDVDQIKFTDDDGEDTLIICLSAAGGRSYTHNTDEAGNLNYATREWVPTRRCNKVLDSDQSYTSNTTLADTGLSLTLEADTLYAIEGTLFVSAHTSGGFKVGFSGTAGVTALLVHLLAQRYENDTGSILGADSLSALGTSFGLNMGAVSGSDMEINFRGFIHTSTAGTLTLRAAQNASFATATTVKKGSYLKFEKADV